MGETAKRCGMCAWHTESHECGKRACSCGSSEHYATFTGYEDSCGEFISREDVEIEPGKSLVWMWGVKDGAEEGEDGADHEM